MAIPIHVSHCKGLHARMLRQLRCVEGCGLEGSISVPGIDRGAGTEHSIKNAIPIEVGESNHGYGWRRSRIEWALLKSSISVTEKDCVAPDEIQLLVMIEVTGYQDWVLQTLGDI